VPHYKVGWVCLLPIWSFFIPSSWSALFHSSDILNIHNEHDQGLGPRYEKREMALMWHHFHAKLQENTLPKFRVQPSSLDSIFRLKLRFIKSGFTLRFRSKKLRVHGLYFKIQIKIKPELENWSLKLGGTFSWMRTAESWQESDITLAPPHFLILWSRTMV